MFFADEPEWMKKARTIPLYSSWDSRQPSHVPMGEGAKRVQPTNSD